MSYLGLVYAVVFCTIIGELETYVTAVHKNSRIILLFKHSVSSL